MHMKEYFEENPPEYARDLFVWTVDFHNAVNKRLKKKIQVFTRETWLKQSECKKEVCKVSAKKPQRLSGTYREVIDSYKYSKIVGKPM